jgi:hypothetical protein
MMQQQRQITRERTVPVLLPIGAPLQDAGASARRGTADIQAVPHVTATERIYFIYYFICISLLQSAFRVCCVLQLIKIKNNLNQTRNLAICFKGRAGFAL